MLLVSVSTTADDLFLVETKATDDVFLVEMKTADDLMTGTGCAEADDTNH